MPPKRANKRKAAAIKARGKSKAPKILLAAHGSSSDMDEEATPSLSRPEQVECVEDVIQKLAQKVDLQCDRIMKEQDMATNVLLRARVRAKSSIPKHHREMGLVKYCEDCGEDYDTVLFVSLTPKEREELMARAGQRGEGEDGSEDENDEPRTTIKGRPPPAKESQTSPTRSARGGRMLRSARKVAPSRSAETPSLSTRGALHSTTNTAARAGTSRAARTTAGKGKVKEDVNTGAIVKASMDIARGGTPAGEAEGSSLPPGVVTELRKRANLQHSVYEHLDAIIQSRIDDVPRKHMERCDRLRRKLAECSAVLRAKVPGGDASSSTGKRKFSDGDTAAVVSPEEEGHQEQVGGTAKVRMSAEGGPYDGGVFEVSVEEDGEARMVGRSTGKKFKLKGISLPKDSEVSVSHGKFEKSEGKVTFTDVGSTNGTMLDGEQLEPSVAYDISTGSELLIGQGAFTVTIAWER